jgi:uncharacterized coiled-coil protein SlyX
MFEYIQFYTKNLSNFTILLLIGVVIAILDITFRNVVTGVYKNVRENMRQRHGGGGSDGTREGMENKKGGGGGGSDGGSGGGSDESCPKDCNAVEAMKTKLTGLIENAAKLQKDIQKNNEVIKEQQKSIETMQRNVEKLAKK